MSAPSIPVMRGGACCTLPPVRLPSDSRVDPALIRQLDDNTGHVDFLVPEMHCAACLTGIESALARVPGVVNARANLTTHRVGVTFDFADGEPDKMLAAIESFGYSARPFDAFSLDRGEDVEGRLLLRCLAVAGFASSNVMLLSVSVWSGADDATRDLFHWISALIALPTLIYAGRPFFRSALRAVSAWRMNMDVPIALALVLAASMSLYETMNSGPHAYFDGVVTLLFFLLIGRYLDFRMRDVARSAAAKLMSLSPRSALRVEADGTAVHVPITEIQPGEHIRIAAGERVPLDGLVVEGQSDIDRSMLTGEPEPEKIGVGGKAFAGMLNLTGPLLVSVTAKATDTLLSEIIRLMEAAERGASRYVRLADRASTLYAPLVHLLAFATIVGWLLVGAGWHMALTTAVTVLIITCPCALGLAVPAVQVVASGLLLQRGVMLKDGAALERLAVADTVVFDKTGTLTEGEPRLAEIPQLDEAEWSVAAALGASSRHPLARALARSANALGHVPSALSDVEEVPGEGMRAVLNGAVVRLGRREWVDPEVPAESWSGSEIWLKTGDAPARQIAFEDALRPDAVETLAALRHAGLRVILLSGDRDGAVKAVAERCGIEEWHAAQRPSDKASFLEKLAAEGRNVLMVGDGINDAPALATAAVSMSPSSAADISQTAAGIVFTGRNLSPVMTAFSIARAARRLIIQNFALSIGYNIVAVPIALFGFATPLIAAIAMSTSSIIVIGNALRLRLMFRDRNSAVPEMVSEKVAEAAV